MLKSFFSSLKWRLVDKRKLEGLKRQVAALQKETRHRKQVENVRKRHLHLLDVLLNTIPDPVYFQDVDGVLQGCNLSFARITGIPRERILGRSIKDLNADCRHHLPEKLFLPPDTAAPTSGVTQVEGKINCADDHIREFLFRKAPMVEADGTTSGTVGVMVDITERKKAEVEKEQLIKELQEAVAAVNILHGMLPICSFCKKIRDDKGYWNQIETYIQAHSSTEFSHSICNECAKEHYPELKIYPD